MTKKKETTTKAKAAEEVKETKKTVAQPKVDKKPTPGDADKTKDSNLGTKEASGSTISDKSTKDTSKEKESLKSAEVKSNGMKYAEAEDAMNKGKLVALPEWGGFWFRSIDNPEETYVLTKEGKITNTPHDEYKERNDWQEVEPTEEQSKLLDDFWKNQQSTIDKEAAKQREEYESLKAVAHAGSRSASFRKLSKKISISDLEEKKNLPADVQRESVFLMNNGFVFDLATSQLTNRQEQEILKSIK